MNPCTVVKGEEAISQNPERTALDDLAANSDLFIIILEID